MITQFFNRAYVAMVTRTQAFAQKFKSDERGVSAIVATILLMLIVVLMVAVFWDKISVWFNNMMDKIFNTAGADQFNADGGKLS